MVVRLHDDSSPVLSHEVRTESAKQTAGLAERFARCLRGGEWLRLLGELGAGKTTFVRGLARGLGWSGTVRSPTFALVACYPTTPVLVHADLYRIASVQEAEDLALVEIGGPDAIIAVEWADRAPGLEHGRPVVTVSLEGFCGARTVSFTSPGAALADRWAEVESL
jgi:tRNA threonylcarbamoyladenosine biosynthesis protein TsaE